MTVYLLNRKRAEIFAEFRDTRRKERKNGERKSATWDRTGDRMDGTRRRTSNARRNAKPDGQMWTLSEQRAMKRESVEWTARN